MGLFFVTSVFAKSGWEKLGEVTADTDLDRVTISCSHKGAFKAIMFKAEGATIDFERVLVRYTTGALDNLNFNQTLRPGQESGVLDLRGNRRVIKEVVLYLKSEGDTKGNKKGKGHAKGRSKRQAKVQIYGKS